MHVRDMGAMVGVGLVAALLATRSDAAPVTFRTKTIRLTIDDQARITSLKDTASQKEYMKAPYPFCGAEVDGRWRYPVKLSAEGTRLRVAFSKTRATAVIAVAQNDTHLVFRVHAVDEKISQLGLLRVRAVRADAAAVGRFLWYPTFALGVIAAGPDVRLQASNGKDGARLRATVYRPFGMVGQRVALFGCEPNRVRDHVRELEKAFDIPGGIDLKTNKANRQSYLMIGGVTAANADRLIGYAQRGGFGSILMLHGTWAHFGRKYAVPKDKWPGGLPQLKQAVDKIHAKGMLAGAHMFSSKVPKVSQYTCPVPDRRIYQDRSATLAGDLDAQADRIATTQAPTDWPRLRGTRDILVDNELITYTDRSLKPPYGFVGCSRGAYGTQAAAHKAGAKLSRPVTDEGRWIFIIDPKTDMLDEVATNIARTYEGAGFDWLYFDGAEDVPPPHWRHVPLAKLPLLRRLKRKPVINQCAAIGTFGWHLTTRVGQRDYFWQSMSSKDEVDDAIRRSDGRTRLALYAGEIGWFPIRRAAPHHMATQIDEVEYLYTKALAADVAVSILTSVQRLDALPHREAILYLMKTLEKLRLENTFPQADRDRVKAPHQDFMLLADTQGRWHLQPAREVPFVGGTSLHVRAFRAAPIDGVTTYSLWNVGGPMHIEFDCLPELIEVTDYRGRPVSFERLPGARVAMDVSQRLYVKLKRRYRMSWSLRLAKVTPIPPQVVVVQAESAEKIVGAFSTGRAAGLDVPKSMGDVIVPTGGFDLSEPSKAYCQYTVDVPHAGLWVLWARVRYDDTNSNSFFYSDRSAGKTHERFGNRMGQYKEWLWDGGLVLHLKKGRHTFRLLGRESRPRHSPLLDVLCLVDQPGCRPDDATVRKALAGATGR